jgi:hypothetical protein
MKNRNTWRPVGGLAVVLVCVLGAPHCLLAQRGDRPSFAATPETQTTPGGTPGIAPGQAAPVAPTAPTTIQTHPPPPAKPAPVSQPPKDDRIFFALPNVLTVENASSLPPLTTRQKFKAEAEGTFDPVEVVFVGIQAGIGQADNTNPTYGQGVVGYSKRFGTAYADTIIASFGTGAIFPSLLHQDPRYYQMGTGSVFHRIGYSAMRVVITRADTTGKPQFNFSEYLGNGMAAGLSNTYHPGPHTVASTGNVLATQILVDVLANELKEFWPDLRRYLLRNRHPK